MQEVQPDQVPEPYRRLLAHHAHMTVTMEAHQRSPIDLRIVDKVRRGHLYARRVLLASARTGRIVQFGIMRFDFRCCSEAVRNEILRERTPLGYILIRHNLLRRIDVHTLFRVHARGELARLFGLSQPAETYGRLATIFCDEQPAVELLEIPAPGLEC